MSLRVGTFLPFTLACFLNGPSFLAQELTRLGIAFRKDDNAFVAVADVAALETASAQLTPRLLEQRCDYWARRLAPSFSAAERAALPLGYRYSIAQIELATDVVFKVIRLLEGVLHPGTFLADWTTRELHLRLLARHRLAADEYRLSQLRYDLGKLRAHGLVERLGTSRRYRLTPRGLKLGVLLVTLQTRLLGPRVSLAGRPVAGPTSHHPSEVEAAFRQVDIALTHLCDTLGLNQAA